MKKKYQIPESKNRFLRTSLVVCSGNNTPDSTTMPSEKADENSPSTADARRRTNVSLLDI